VKSSVRGWWPGSRPKPESAELGPDWPLGARWGLPDGGGRRGVASDAVGDRAGPKPSVGKMGKLASGGSDDVVPYARHTFSR